MPVVLDAAAAAHLLRRVGWAPTQAEVDALVGLDQATAVDTVLTASPPPLTGLPNPWVTDPALEPQAHAQMLAWWVDRMAATTAPVVERMALFWHGHFCSAQSKVSHMGWMWTQNNLFRTHALGDFRQLCQAVAIDPAMLWYLDNQANVRGLEQENFAREVMELFTLGIGQHTETDVVAMAKAWTGYNIVGWNGSYVDKHYRYYAARHDPTDKTLFGITRPWTGPEAIDEICLGSKADAMAHFVAAKVFRFLAHPTPAAATVDALAAAFLASGLSILELVRGVLLSDDFWAPVSRYALVKSPVDFVVSTLRCLGLPAGSAALPQFMPAMGQVLFDPPDVSGWKQNDAWLSTALVSARGRWLEFLRFAGPSAGWSPSAGSLAPVAAVQGLFDQFRIFDPDPATRAALETWCAAAQGYQVGPAYDGVVAVGLSPDFQVV